MNNKETILSLYRENINSKRKIDCLKLEIERLNNIIVSYEKQNNKFETIETQKEKKVKKISNLEKKISELENNIKEKEIENIELKKKLEELTKFCEDLININEIDGSEF